MSSMLRKKEVYTIVTPIPGFIPRQLAIDILHSHSEVITLNPLVLDHKPIKAPQKAASDEYYSTWYEINQRIQYVPGLGKMGSGKISFNGCFHDMPWGLQTHIYAPMNVDLRNKYRIAGNQPGVEPPEQPEIGLAALGAPSDGLYLRDDVEIKCNVAVMSFVKAQMKAASKEMVSRIIKKAELLDAGVLHAMIEDGKLKTINPNDRTNTISDGQLSPRPSPTSLYHQPGSMSPTPVPYQIPRPSSYQHHNKPGTPVQNTHWSAPYGGQQSPHFRPSHAELPGPQVGGLAQQAQVQQAQQAQTAGNFAFEMPGDFSYPQPSPHLQPPQPSPTYNSEHGSTVSGHSSRMSPQPANDWRWSQSQGASQGNTSRPTSVSSDVSGGFQSPGLDHQGFASELATHNETPEEHNISADALKKLDAKVSPAQQAYAYNPADYAKGRNHYLAQARSQSYGYSH
ncbi:hypothetical protein J7T55_007362 [Diaporthe amygdali]|uniref:uncharacterized protein n=1 Tax=Phomopsis amygdali TaxID=1214568 RepID=UPI0022FDFB7D|nr:uncharacterized protein J7T55_007362 [Diaporthe amygdali]KAJ0116382.1 hypothetical protein J7T55_007362 [Diaporthe amygdali]